jgi:hypothetical protein
MHQSWFAMVLIVMAFALVIAQLMFLKPPCCYLVEAGHFQLRSKINGVLAMTDMIINRPHIRLLFVRLSIFVQLVCVLSAVVRT